MNQEVAKELKKEFRNGIFPTLLLVLFLGFGIGIVTISSERAALVSPEAELIVYRLWVADHVSGLYYLGCILET